MPIYFCRSLLNFFGHILIDIFLCAKELIQNREHPVNLAQRPTGTRQLYITPENSFIMIAVV